LQEIEALKYWVKVEILMTHLQFRKLFKISKFTLHLFNVTFDEDRSQVRCGNIPQVMATLRNTAIGLPRWAGYTNIAAACRRLAAQPGLALTLIGIELEN